MSEIQALPEYRSLVPGVSSGRRLAEILQAEALLKAKAGDEGDLSSLSGAKKSPHRATGKPRGRPKGKKGKKKPASRRAVAEATGVPDATRHDLEEHVRLAERFPLHTFATPGRRGIPLDPAVSPGYSPPMTPAGLKRIRRELGLTQEELAEAVGVDRVTVARWETGMRPIAEPVARLIRRIRAEGRGKRKSGGKGREPRG